MRILVWILLLSNLFTVLAFIRGFSLVLLLVILIIALIGIKILIASDSAGDLLLESPVNKETQELMQGVILIGEEIFEQEIQKFSQPLLDSIYRDFSRSLSWLWEDKDAFIVRGEEVMNELTSIPALIVSLNEEKGKMIKNLLNYKDATLYLLDELKNTREYALGEMKQLLEEKLEELKNTMQKEKDIFFDYLHKLLLAQIRKQEGTENEEEFDAKEYFNVNNLGEQFALSLEKSLETRAMDFQDKIIQDMEDVSADLVGKMQNNTMKLMNSLNEIKQNLAKLLDVSKNEDQMLLQRLNQSNMKTAKLRDQAEEVMLTLAWQDILVEKRWEEIENQLLQIREQVNKNVEEDVIEYIKTFVEDEIPSFSLELQNRDRTAFTQALIDAELIYQLYSGNKLSEIIQDGSYSLLIFIEPVDYLVRRNIRITQKGQIRRKSIDLRNDLVEYEESFQKVIAALQSRKRELIHYIKDLFPRSFYSYCNNPYLKQKPENLNQAAWTLFIDLLGTDHDDSGFYLVGLLLLIHQMRNKYIQPFKALPRNIENKDELEHMRFCAFKAINLLLAEQEQILNEVGSA